ncbi:MAG TPA: HlyD family efflux transporter periplasmic adaptor subunit [Lachnospiraceae bacterium]|nr:HlyD family efflux transporter periplasmic adaptor subunit [Lachnospiraceae bacterium]
MNTTKGNRREWVKTAAIIFLSVMLALTFFSNTIMNYSLPEVAAQYIQSGTITAKVRGTGTVESGSLYNIKVAESRKVTSVDVRVGDKVVIGDEICHLDDTESDELKAAKDALDKAQQAYDTALLAGTISTSVLQNAGNTSSVATYQSQLLSAQKQVDEIKQKITVQAVTYNETKAANDAAQLKLTEANNNLANINSWLSYQGDVSSGNANAIDTLKKQKNEASQIALAAQNTTNVTALAFKTAESEKTSLEAQLAEAQDSVTELAKNINDSLSLGILSDGVVKAQAEVDRLKQKAVGATVTAEVAGTITSVSVVAGENTSPDTPVAVIQPDGKGYSLSFSISAEQAKRISIGDPAELVNSWWYNDITATVASIKPDPNDPARKKLVTFDLNGELTAGQSLSLQVGEKSANYDMIVPNSAIREDNNGKFVLIVESKPSPLGTRYYAVRYDVEVLASDDTQTAISGGLYGYEYVITTSTKPVEAGKLVRLPD